MAATYESIMTYTVSGSSTNTVTFNSIPGTYTDLVLIGSGGYTWSDTLISMTVNNDTGSNYSHTELVANGSTVTCGKATNETSVYVGWYPYPRTHAQAQTDTGNLIVHFMDYANTSKNKTMLNRNNTAFGNTGAKSQVILWRSNAAITRIDLFFGAYGTPYFTSGSQFTLYGIKAA